MTRDRDHWVDLLRRYIRPGITGIYTELSYHQFNKIQQVLIELFGDDRNIKFIKATMRAREIKTAEEIHRQISLYHTVESMHSGIIETFNSLKNKLYYPKLVEEITKVINNCKTCLETKYERKPFRVKYKISETPTSINEILHMDIYYFMKQAFLTLIDKLTKKAYIYHLQNRNWNRKIEVLEEHFSKFGKPQKIITDNEFASINIKDFFRTQGIALHFTKPNTHTGNSDIERFHSTLQEKLVSMRKLDLTLLQKIHRAVSNYNDRYHSSIKMTPNQAVRADPAMLEKTLKEYKNKYINKLNKKREDYRETRRIIPVKNYKRNYYKNEPRYRIKELGREHPINIKRPRKFAGDDLSLGSCTATSTISNTTDRQEIVEHIQLIEENCENAVQNLNK